MAQNISGPKLPNDGRANLSVKWQNRWPHVIYRNAMLQGALSSALVGREVEVSATATFCPPTIVPRTKSASALISLNGVTGGGPLDWQSLRLRARRHGAVKEQAGMSV